MRKWANDIGKSSLHAHFTPQFSKSQYFPDKQKFFGVFTKQI